ncbi:GlsB/YeaQ/YmgE family stress response membrane protein [Candidatus Daviesbacteria bacterium]|nr:GlsB/YeaQ/YmgE family stress response membrane protein [Candidatus Daviesbacteria bacterium]
MNLLFFLIFGLITGVVANWIDPHPESGGIIGAIILGILGALVGGFIGNLTVGQGITGFNIPSFAISILGALLVLFIARTFRRV